MNNSSRPVIAQPSKPLRLDKNTKVKVYGSTLSLTVDKRVLWMLNELGLAYELIEYDVIKGEQSSPEYLNIHPSALVPAIQIGDFYMLESVAILMLLADHFPEHDLAPPPGDVERPAYLQWMLYGASTLEGVTSLVTLSVPDGLEPNPELLQAQLEVFDRYVITLEKVLEERAYMLARGFSAADISISWNLHTAGYLGLLDQYPGLKRYYDRLAQRPAFQAAYQGDDYYQAVERASAEA